MKYSHKYHYLFPLNIFVGYIKRKIKGIRSFLHFLSFSIGLSDLMKQVDKEMEKDSID